LAERHKCKILNKEVVFEADINSGVYITFHWVERIGFWRFVSLYSPPLWETGQAYLIFYENQLSVPNSPRPPSSATPLLQREGLPTIIYITTRDYFINK